MAMRDQILAVKAEATPGTFESLTGADCMHTGVFIPAVQEFEQAQSTMVSGLPGNSRAAAMVMKKSSFAIPFDFVTSGAPGTAPPMAKLLLALGYTQTTVTGTSVTYTLGQTATPSATRFSAITGVDNQRYALSGGLGTEMEITCEPGSLVTATCTLQGKYVPPTDVSNLTPTFPPAAAGMVFNSSTVLSGTAMVVGYAACVSAFSYKLTNAQPFVDDAGCAPRSEHTNREVTGSITIRRLSLSAFDPFALVENSVLGSIVIPFNRGAGDTFTINCPKVQFLSAQLEDVDGLPYVSMEWSAIHQATSDFSRFIFT